MKLPWSSVVLRLTGVLTFCALATTASAQRVYDVVLQGVPLEEALTELMSRTDLVLGFDQRLVAGKWTHCVTSGSLEEEVLQCVLRGTGLEYFRLPSGLYVLTESNESKIQYGALHGIVVDDETGDPLEYAHVMLNQGHYAVSNQDGRFIFGNLEPGVYALTTTYLGYANHVAYVAVSADSVVQARLALQQQVLGPRTPVVIHGVGWRVPSDTLGQVTLNREAILRASGGMLPDVGRALSTLSGIRINDATADLHIQSSGAGEHQYRLDNAPVFVPVSIGGLVGPFSPYALSHITVHKTGFGADVGSQTAGVIAATHALGATAGRRLDVQVDPMSVNARANHLLGGGSALMAAGRFGLWRVFAPPAVHGMLHRWNQTDQFMYSAFRAVPTPTALDRRFSEPALVARDPGLHFSDVHLALRSKHQTASSVYASAYWGRRQLDSQEHSEDVGFRPLSQLTDEAPMVQDRYVWDNLTGQLRYESVLGARAMVSAQARVSLFRMQHHMSKVEITQQNVPVSGASLYSQVDLRDDNGNRIREYGLAGRITYALWRGWNVEAGIEPAYTHSRFLVHGTRSAPIAHASGTWRVESFVQQHIPIAPRLTVDAGTRVTYLRSRNAWYAEPRLAARYDVHTSRIGSWSARLATGLYRQYVTQFDVTSRSARALRSSSRMWMVIDESVAPPKAAHFSLEVVVQPNESWTLRAEGYGKQLMHLLSINYVAGAPNEDSGPVIGDATDLSTFITDGTSLPSQQQAGFLSSGSGHAYGLSASASTQVGRVALKSRYEFSRTERSFGAQFDGRTLVAPWNEPHRVELESSVHLTEDLTFQARWQTIWGRAWGFRQSYYDFLGAYGEELFSLVESPRWGFPNTGFDLLSVPLVIDHIEAYRLQHPEEHRMPPLNQLDLALYYNQTIRESRFQVRADVLNVLGSKNVADWGLVSQEGSDDALLGIQERTLLPVTPSLALRYLW